MTGTTGEPGVDQRLDQQPVAVLEDHPDLARTWLESQTPTDQPDPGRVVLDAELLDDSYLHCSQGKPMELLGPIDAGS